jgi:two-component system response regulator PilR (NtrC family)
VLSGIVGDDPAVEAIRAQAARLVTGGRLPPVLILGETGSGKTLLARELHGMSARAPAALVHVNCAAIPENLLEAQLFGVEKGAFTDAREDKPGLLHAAHGGTLFLDEIGHLPLALQPKLLTVIEEWSVRRIGATKAEAVDVWLIAATSEDLERAVAGQRFMSALYYRLAVVSFRVPPLRERAGDLPRIAARILERSCRTYGLPTKQLTAEALDALARHPWPGNVRELGNVLERAALLGEGVAITPEMLQLGEAPRAAGQAPVARYRRKSDDEREQLERALAQAQGNVSSAARLSGSHETPFATDCGVTACWVPRPRRHSSRRRPMERPAGRASGSRSCARSGTQGKRCSPRSSSSSRRRSMCSAVA